MLRIKNFRLAAKEKMGGKVYFVPLMRAGAKFLSSPMISLNNLTVKAMLGVTFQCQCSCSYCGSRIYDKKLPEPSFDDLRFFISEVSNLPHAFSCISFFGGEPLIREDIHLLVRFTVRKGLFCEIESNGILLDSKKAILLKQAGLHHIFVSIDSTDSKEHDKIKKIDGCFDSAIQAIRNCLKENLSCSISTCVSKNNIQSGEVKKIIEMARKLKVKSVRLLSPVSVEKWKEGGNASGSFGSAGEEELNKFLDRDFVYWESTKHNTPLADKRCAVLDRDFFYISPYGEIQPCPYFPASFGNCKDESLYMILGKMWGELIRNCNKTSCLANDFDVRDYFINSSFKPSNIRKCQVI